MKQADAFRSAEAPKASTANGAGGHKPAVHKPVGPVTYTVTRGSDVFWSGKQGTRGKGVNDRVS